MDMKDLQPIIDLMTQQEERFVTKMNEVHADVKLTKAQATATNGKVAEQEQKIFQLQQEAKTREQTCGVRLKNLEPNIATVKAINYVTNKPKTVLFMFVVVVMLIQVVVTEAIENNWLSDLINVIKP